MVPYIIVISIVVVISAGLGVLVGLKAAQIKKVVNYNNGLVLSGSNYTYYNNVNLIFSADLEIKDNAVLNLTNCIVTMDLSDGPNTAVIKLYGSGQLIMKDCVITQFETPYKICNCEISQYAKVDFVNVKREGVWWSVSSLTASYSSVGGNTGLTLSRGWMGSVKIANESKLELELYLGAGTREISGIPTLGEPLSSSSGFMKHMIDTNNWPGATIDIVNCFTQEIDIAVTRTFFTCQLPLF